MNCRRAGKGIPLYAGGELLERHARRLERHLEGCPDCRAKADDFRVGLAAIRSVARRDELDWTEAEWRRLMTRIKTLPPPRRAVPVGAQLKPAWAVGILAVFLLALSVIFLRPRVFRPAPIQPMEILTSTEAQPGRSLEFAEGQFPHSPEDIPFAVQKEKPRPAEQKMIMASSSGGKNTQETLSMTLVSQETGLKVHWTFNRKFEWKEEAKR